MNFKRQLLLDQTNCLLNDRLVKLLFDGAFLSFPFMFLKLVSFPFVFLWGKSNMFYTLKLNKLKKRLTFTKNNYYDFRTSN